ncbi:MAG: response regulator [Desulfobacterales bacterium]|nr:response regulator [Desulfobacterales bacterium]MCF8080420.1 response regulator [Desulfobacterales bacterium]
MGTALPVFHGGDQGPNENKGHMTTRKAKILVVDDEPDMCWALVHIVENSGMVARRALSGADALELLSKDDFQMIFLDAKLPDIDGLQLALKIRRLQPSIRIVLVSGYYYQGDRMVKTALKKKHINGFVSKPFENETILKVIESIPSFPTL